MAKNDDLHDFLKDLADTIRDESYSTDPINPQDFTAQIRALPKTGGVGRKTEQGGEIFNDYDNNLSYNEMAHSEGQHTEASGVASHAEGNNTIAQGDYSHAEGDETFANAESAHAEGNSCTANAMSSHAEGQATIANGRGAHSEGGNTQASGPYSHAEGNNTIADGIYAHAEGKGTTASGLTQHVQGRFNIPDSKGTYAHIVGNGTDNTNLSNAHTIDWKGNAWYQGNVHVGENNEKLTTQKDNDKRYLPINEINAVTPQTKFSVDNNALNYRIYGNSVQETRSGKNLFDYTKYPLTASKYISITNGEAVNANFKCTLDYIPINPNTIYSINKYTSTTIAGNAFYDENKNFISGISKTATFTTPNNARYMRFTFDSLVIANEIQLELGTTATPYEPYGATPSPEFPSEIQSVGDLVTKGEYAGKYKVETVIHGNNVYNPLNIKKMLYNGKLTDKSSAYDANNYVTSDYIDMYAYKYIAINKGGAYAWYNDKDENHIVGYDNKSVFDMFRCYEKPANARYVRITSPIDTNIIAQLTNVVVTSVKEYEPFVEPTTITAYLDEPLRKIGDYADYIDFENQKVVRNIVTKVVNGTEGWTYVLDGSSVNKKHEVFLTLTDKVIRTDSSVKMHVACNYFKGVDRESIYSDSSVDNAIAYSSRYLRIISNNLIQSSDLSGFKSFLSNRYSSGNPVIIYYILETSAEEPITLAPMPLKDGTNNVITTTSVQPSDVYIKYYQNPTDVINELRQDNTTIEALKNAIISLGGNI